MRCEKMRTEKEIIRERIHHPALTPPHPTPLFPKAWWWGWQQKKGRCDGACNVTFSLRLQESNIHSSFLLYLPDPGLLLSAYFRPRLLLCHFALSFVGLFSLPSCLFTLKGLRTIMREIDTFTATTKPISRPRHSDLFLTATWLCGLPSCHSANLEYARLYIFSGRFLKGSFSSKWAFFFLFFQSTFHSCSHYPYDLNTAPVALQYFDAGQNCQNCWMLLYFAILVILIFSVFCFTDILLFVYILFPSCVRFLN